MGENGVVRVRDRVRRRVWPLRLRLTAAFASVIALVLAACGVVIYLQFAHYIDGRTDEELRERSITFTSLAVSEVSPRRIVALSGEAFAQVYGPDGRVLATTRPLGNQRLLTVTQVRAARRRPLLADRPATAPTDDGVRLRGFALEQGAVAVIAESRDDRERELNRLATLLLLSLPGALLLASLTGYQVAGAALAPVERMRSRAAQIGDADLSERLEEPGTGDELDRLATTLNDLLQRLQGALERERRIVGDASHELRTPISVLRTRLDVALRSDGDAAGLRAVLAEAQADAVRLTRLADDLLVLARADQGQLPLRREPVEVQQLLEEAAGRHRPAAVAAARTIDASVEIDGGAVLYADPDRMAQVLDNLVVNALRYGSGVITLAARPASTPGCVDLSVADTGVGFPAGLADRAFERFSQGEAARALGGSGLGLAIVEAIVRAHGGSVLADNRPEGGAVVRVRLPQA